MRTKNQNGIALLAVLLVVLALGVGGYYMYSTGKLNLDMMSDTNINTYKGQFTGTSMPSGSPSTENISTSSQMTLTLNSPLSGITLNSTTVVVSGKTSPYAEVFVNDQSTKADAQGNFSVNLTLDEGSNNLVVTANDADGNVVEQNVSVNVQTF